MKHSRILLGLTASLLIHASAWANPSQNRINLWPLLYANDEGVHLLGPIVKAGEDHFALRPLFALNTRHHTRLRVLYPLCELNFGDDPNWIFPCFWGEDYRVVFPFYWRFGQPYGEDARGYHGVLPLYSLSRKRDYYSLYAPWPLVRFRDGRGEREQRAWPLYGHRESAARTATYALWPLSRWWTEAANARSGSYLFPLYYRETSDSGDRFLSLPWSFGSEKDSGYEWKASFPLFYHGRGPNERSLVTLPWTRIAEGESSRWICPPLLSWGRENGGERSWRTSLGLAGGDSGPDHSTRYALPLFYQSRDAQQRIFLSLPYSHREDHDAQEAWTAVAPLYFNSRSPQRALHATPLGGWQKRADGSFQWNVYPLLTWMDRGEDEFHFWALAPLFNYSNVRGVKKHHLLPFYGCNQATQRFTSPLYARWQKDGTTHILIPPLLARLDRQGDATDLWAAAGLFRQRWDAQSGRQAGHLLPLYAFEGTNRFYSLLFGYERNTPHAATYYATPLVGRYTGSYQGFWVWPLYRSKVHRESGHYDDYHTLLLGRRWAHAGGRGSRLFPLYSHRRSSWRMPEDAPAPTAAPIALKQIHQPIASESNEFNVLLLGRRKTSMRQWMQGEETLTEHSRSHRLFPLWSHRSSMREPAGSANAKTSVLLGLYTAKTSAQGGSENVRRRLLWKLWDYDRRGGVVEVDAFPFITYDRSPGGAKETSFLWRLFRYGRDDQGGRSLDLAFIPLMRPAGR